MHKNSLMSHVKLQAIQNKWILANKQEKEPCILEWLHFIWIQLAEIKHRDEWDKRADLAQHLNDCISSPNLSFHLNLRMCLMLLWKKNHVNGSDDVVCTETEKEKRKGSIPT